MNRRSAIKSVTASVIPISLAGCTGGNKKVVEKYETGHVLFREAKSIESDGGELNQAGNDKEAREKWETASKIYDSAAEKFEVAKRLADSPEVRKYCKQAFDLASIKSKEMADLAKGNQQKALLHNRNSQESEHRVVEVKTVKEAATGFL